MPSNGEPFSTSSTSPTPSATEAPFRIMFTDAKNFATKHAYSRAGELLESTAPNGTALETNDYDSLGRLVSSKDPLGRQSATLYRTDHRVDRNESRTPTGAVLESEAYGYDIPGRSVTTTNKRGEVFVVKRDALGRVISSKQSKTVTPTLTFMESRYGYDANGSLTRLTDGRGMVTTYTYNSWNLQETLVEPGTEPVADRIWTTSYDISGNPVKDVEPGNVTAVRTFDTMGRLKSVVGTDPDTTNGQNASKTFDYDEFGRLKTFGSPTGTRTVEYSAFGELKAVKVGATIESSFQYDQLGQMTSRSDAAGSSTFSWTPQGELERQTVTAGGAAKGAVQYGWVGGELRTVDYLNASGATTGTQRNFGYDGVGRLTADVVTKGSTTAAWASYAYDDAGNVTAQQYGLPGNAGAGLHTYGYDFAGRLTSWTRSTGVATQGGATTVYGYDDAGNRTMANGVSYGYDNRNRLLSASDGATYGYTKRGTLLTETKGGSTTLSKTDALGRVVSTGAVSYSYDSWDRLISRSQGGTTNNFVFAGLETDPVADGTATYSRSPGDSVIATTSGTTTRWTGTNRHGDVTQLLDPTATNPLVGSQTFDPFGQPISAPALNLGYQGDWTDPTTKQPWMAARWYQPKTATFTTRDTLLGSVGGPTVAHNRHTYANNNPLTYWDPTGRVAVLDNDGPCRVECMTNAANGFAADGDVNNWWASTQAIARGYDSEHGLSNSMQGTAYALDRTQAAIIQAVLAGKAPSLFIASQSLEKYSHREFTFAGGLVVDVRDFVVHPTKDDRTSTSGEFNRTSDYVRNYGNDEEYLFAEMGRECALNGDATCFAMELLVSGMGVEELLDLFDGQYRPGRKWNYGALGSAWQRNSGPGLRLCHRPCCRIRGWRCRRGGQNSSSSHRGQTRRNRGGRVHRCPNWGALGSKVAVGCLSHQRG